MDLWGKIKGFFQYRLEEHEKAELFLFTLGSEYVLSYLKPKCSKNQDDGLAHKRHLTLTYTYQEGADLLAKKQAFIDQYTKGEKKQLDDFICDPENRKNVDCCKVWRDHEQEARLSAQYDWQKVVCYNRKKHMFQKFINQKTR